LNMQEEFIAWKQRCKFIESLDELNCNRIKRPQLSIGLRQSIIAHIVRLENMKNSVRGRFVHVGYNAARR